MLTKESLDTSVGKFLARIVAQSKLVNARTTHSRLLLDLLSTADAVWSSPIADLYARSSLPFYDIGNFHGWYVPLDARECGSSSDEEATDVPAGDGTSTLFRGVMHTIPADKDPAVLGDRVYRIISSNLEADWGLLVPYLNRLSSYVAEGDSFEIDDDIYDAYENHYGIARSRDSSGGSYLTEHAVLFAGIALIKGELHYGDPGRAATLLTLAWLYIAATACIRYVWQ